MAQEFLNPVAVQAPTFLQNGTVNSGGAQGMMNNSSMLTTQQQAYHMPLPQGRGVKLPTAGVGLMAPGSVNPAAFPSGQYSYGFTGSQSAPLGGLNHYGFYNGMPLPMVSTGSVDLNIVDCPNIASNYAPGQFNPYAYVPTLTYTNPDGSIRNINFQETKSEAQDFLDNALDDAGQYLSGITGQ